MLLPPAVMCCLVAAANDSRLHCRAYGLKSLSNADLRDLYRRLEQSPALLETYYWNMKAQARNSAPCTTSLCRAKTLCSVKWWTTKGEYLACVDGAVTTASLVRTIATKSGGGGGASSAALEPSDVYVVVVLTMVVTTLIVGIVLSVMRGLRRSGAIKTPAQREERGEKDNIFPML